MSYRRLNWKYEPKAKCTECGEDLPKYYNERGNQPRYNLNQITCGPTCARRRKTRLQRTKRYELWKKQVT